MSCAPRSTRLLILAQQLSDNVEGNLHAKQIQFAQTIYSAGSDLLTLINDILDLSKIESGTVTVDPSDVSFTRNAAVTWTALSGIWPTTRTSIST